MITYKTAEEIKTMEKAGSILRKALNEAQSYTKVGKTTNDIDKHIDNFIVDAGAEPGFKRVQGYSWASCICVNDQIVHTPPSDRVIEEGDVVTIDAGVYLDGLHTDSAVTVQVGKKDPKVTKFLETGKKALNAALKQAVLGNRIGHISRAFQQIIEPAGYTIIPELTGHGVGKDLHEDPYVPCFLDRPVEKTIKLKEGMTLALEVMYTTGSSTLSYEPDGWSIKVADGGTTACFEHTVAIQSNKPFILS